MTEKLIQYAKVSVVIFGMTFLNFSVDGAEKNYLEGNYYEGGLKYHSLTAGFSEWTEGYGKGSWQQDSDNRWEWEMLASERFNESGVFFSGGLNHIFNDDWYGSKKLDGCRCLTYINDTGNITFYSRKGKVFEVLDNLIEPLI